MAAKSPLDAVPRYYLRGASFAHMTRRATEARSSGVAKWIGDHVKSKRRYTPPKEPKLRKELRHERKALADRYCQLLSGHAATGDYLCNKIHQLSPDECWWCGQDERQTRHHLFVNCAAWSRFGPHVADIKYKKIHTVCIGQTTSYNDELTSSRDNGKPTRLTTTVCTSRRQLQRRDPWADGWTSHDRNDTGSPMARPVEQFSQEGVGPTPEKRLRDRQHGGKMFGQVATNHNTPHPHL